MGLGRGRQITCDVLDFSLDINCALGISVLSDVGLSLCLDRVDHRVHVLHGRWQDVLVVEYLAILANG